MPRILGAGGALGSSSALAGSRMVPGQFSRQVRLSCQAKLKYNVKIAQNHNKGVRVNVDLDKLYTDATYKPDTSGRLHGPIKLAPIPGAWAPVRPASPTLCSMHNKQ